jgi:uncharacterized cupin superfamily protein
VPDYAKATVDPGDWEPFHAEVVDGSPDGKVHWLWRPDAGHSQFGGVYVSTPGTIRFTLGGDESVHVLEGEVHIEFDDGQTLDLRAGDVASFPGGSTLTWTMTTPFKEFFTVSRG